MTDQDIFYEYEQVLLGKRKNYSSDIFAGRSAAGKEEMALRFFRCIFEKYLLWTPEEAYHELNNNILEKMKLTPLVRFIRFPDDNTLYRANATMPINSRLKRISVIYAAVSSAASSFVT